MTPPFDLQSEQLQTYELDGLRAAEAMLLAERQAEQYVSLRLWIRDRKEILWGLFGDRTNNSNVARC